MYLLNAIVMNTDQGMVQLPAGRLIPADPEQQARVAASGGQMWPATDAKVADAAAYVGRQRGSRGIDEQLATQIMMLAAEQSLMSKPQGGWGA
jgi:hypothetical protein